MKKLSLFLSLLLILSLSSIAEERQPTFKISVEQVAGLLESEDPLLYLEDTIKEYLWDHPLAATYIASEINISNGSRGEMNRPAYGERLMFNKLVTSTTVRDILYKVDIDDIYYELTRLLYGPWYSKGAKTYSTHKNVGWFPWHLDLHTGEWYKTDPRSIDVGIRIFHYTDYYENMRTRTLGIGIDWDSLEDGYYDCILTVIRK